MSEILALDIGGANLKLADGRGLARSVFFPLWKQPNELSAAIARLLHDAPPARKIVATMTGELADCFPTKADGVRAIVAAIREASAGRELKIYLVDGRFVDPDEACEQPLLAAASNWHALASFAARWVDQAGLLIDIGSTTTDLIPIVDGRPAATGLNDPQRLASGELVYTGVVRSPLCGVVRQLPWRGRMCDVAQEIFATTLDAYLVLGLLPEDPHATHTADGRAATRDAAHDRLARMICADRRLFSWDDAVAAAEVVYTAQLDHLADKLAQVVRRMSTVPRTVVISGQGEFLARSLLRRQLPDAAVVSLAERLGPEVSQVAPAHALAVLAFSLPSPLVREGGLSVSVDKPVEGLERVPGFHPSPDSLRSPPSPARGEGKLCNRRVVKIGGSLLDLPDVWDRLGRWLRQSTKWETILVFGGGALADAIRDLDARFQLDPTAPHWWCVQAMTIHAELAASKLPDCRWLHRLDELPLHGEPGRTYILDPFSFLRHDDAPSSARLPESWQVTSDSIAARFAELIGADELLLLKSAPPPSSDWSDCAAAGYVDPCFPSIAARLSSVRAVDFRQESVGAGDFEPAGGANRLAGGSSGKIR